MLVGSALDLVQMLLSGEWELARLPDPDFVFALARLVLYSLCIRALRPATLLLLVLGWLLIFEVERIQPVFAFFLFSQRCPLLLQLLDELVQLSEVELLSFVHFRLLKLMVSVIPEAQLQGQKSL